MSEQASNKEGNDGGSVTVVLPTEARRLRREAKAVEIIKNITGDRWRKPAKQEKPPWQQEIFCELKPNELVYFMYSGGLIKIGYTANIIKRFGEIQNMGSTKVELIAVIPGNKQMEQMLHRMFKADRKHSEWFRLSDDIRKYLGCLDEAVIALMPPDDAAKAGSCLDRLKLAEAAPVTP